MLKGLVSLVTGGASGLGRGTVKRLAKRGGHVVLVDLPASDGQKVADTFQGDVTFVPCDVTSEADVRAAVGVCRDKFGRLDVVVNCAGLERAYRLANPASGNAFRLEDLNTVLDSHLLGTFNVVRLAAPVMGHNDPRPGDGGRGVMIMVGSISADDGVIGQCAYAAAKGGIVAMTLPMARELAPLGIRAVTISPGFFYTPLMSEVCLTRHVIGYLEEQNLFPKRFGYPREFAKTVQTVIENPMLNGVNIKLSAGARHHIKVIYQKKDS